MSKELEEFKSDIESINKMMIQTINHHTFSARPKKIIEGLCYQLQELLKEEVEVLAEPVQYGVNYVIDTIPSKWENKASWAVPISIHSRLKGRYDSVDGMKEATLKEFNAARFLLKLPPITIEQITFEEV